MACTRCEQSGCRDALTRASSAAAITDNPSSAFKTAGAGRRLECSRPTCLTASEFWAAWVCGCAKDALSANPHNVSAPAVFARNRLAGILMPFSRMVVVTVVLGHPPGVGQRGAGTLARRL